MSTFKVLQTWDTYEIIKEVECENKRKKVDYYSITNSLA